jgi:propanol-preferring alcohol dehydrogenase
MRADFALRIPAGFGDVGAAPLLCGGVIGYRALKLSGIEPGARLGLYGFGASGRLAVQVALHWGCEVFVATRSRAEQQRALDMGAAWAGAYRETPPARLHAAVTFAPVGYVVVEALKALERGGTVAVNAIHLDRIPGFPYDLLWWERSIRSVANYTRRDAVEFLELAQSIPIETAVEEHRLDDANLALATLRSGDIEGTAVLVP